MIRILLLLFLISGLCVIPVESRKIRNTLKVEKESKSLKDKEVFIEGEKINISDTISSNGLYSRREIGKLLDVSFAGYDKEANSSKESFIIINLSPYFISGFEIMIEYLDMQGRMLHSRLVKESCEVPPGESRRLDIKSWDTQHTYYYHLGNEPKRVATSFKVNFIPRSYWIKP